MVKNMISIIIPTCQEQFLQPTVDDLLKKAEGEIEIIVVLDNYWPEPLVKDDPRVIIIHRSERRGMRDGINSGVAISKGEHILKVDAHCMFDQGFDVKLLAEYKEDNWIMIPRRKRLDAENWCVQDVGKPDIDYELISSPSNKGIKGQIWTQRALDRKDILVDENMTFQGSCYLMSRKHWDWLGGLHEEGYGSFVREAQEIGLKTWLGGGKIMTNKKTWYAHLHKGPKYGRGYFIDKRKMDKGDIYCDDFWMNNKWEDAKHDLAWLIERFGGDKVPDWTNELIDKVRKK